jgi:hypothetical protein
MYSNEMNLILPASLPLQTDRQKTVVVVGTTYIGTDEDENQTKSGSGVRLDSHVDHDLSHLIKTRT